MRGEAGDIMDDVPLQEQIISTVQNPNTDYGMFL